MLGRPLKKQIEEKYIDRLYPWNAPSYKHPLGKTTYSGCYSLGYMMLLPDISRQMMQILIVLSMLFELHLNHDYTVRPLRQIL